MPNVFLILLITITVRFMRTFEQIAREMNGMGMRMPARKVEVCVPDARKVLQEGLSYFLGLEGRRAEWLPEYEQVADWLAGNGGRGLFLFGNCGRGKSVLCRYVLPAILLDYMRKVVAVYDMQELNRDVDGVLRKHIVSLDDVGTEELSVKYGEKRLAFAEVMDAAEKYGKLVIVSTNLTPEDLRFCYGDRVIDRIRSTMQRVAFNGKSLRK